MENIRHSSNFERPRALQMFHFYMNLPPSMIICTFNNIVQNYFEQSTVTAFKKDVFFFPQKLMMQTKHINLISLISLIRLDIKDV